MGRLNIDLDRLCARVLRDFGAVTGLVRLPRGEETGAYRFRSSERDLVLRTGSTDEGFRKDVLAHSRFSREELLVPAVLRIARAQDCQY